MEKIEADRIVDIGLLSAEEVKAARTTIPPVSGNWWLRAPGHDGMVSIVYEDGSIITGVYVNDAYIGVRPALWVNQVPVLPIGEKALFGNCVWTQIAEGIFLCDAIICWMNFRKDWKAEDANAYEASNVNTFLSGWLLQKLMNKGCNIKAFLDKMRHRIP